MMNYLEELNESQCNVVFYNEGFFLVIVGVGLGKICVLIYKIVYLLEWGYIFWFILVLIFINKVVCEMKECIVCQVGDQVCYLWMGMFYFIFLCILWCEVQVVGFIFNFIIYDFLDLKSLIKFIVKEM